MGFFSEIYVSHTRILHLITNPPSNPSHPVIQLGLPFAHGTDHSSSNTVQIANNTHHKQIQLFCNTETKKGTPSSLDQMPPAVCQIGLT